MGQVLNEYDFLDQFGDELVFITRKTEVESSEFLVPDSFNGLILA